MAEVGLIQDPDLPRLADLLLKELGQRGVNVTPLGPALPEMLTLQSNAKRL